MTEKQKHDIAYQNKDIASKIFADKFAGKSLKVYGIDLPKIKQVLPTNLPVIQANELRIDNLFLLEDDTFLLLDYESSYRKENKLKYLGYVLRILERYNKKYGFDMKIYIVIIYTADVTEEKTQDSFDVHSVKMKLEQAFLCKLDSEQIKLSLTTKIRQGKKLTEEELMQYIILPLTYSGTQQKKTTIQELFELTKEIAEEETQLFLLSGILVFTDKIIDKETAKRIKEWIRMTKVAKLFEEEKMEAVHEALQQEAIETAKEMLKDRNSVEKIARYVKRLSIKEVEKLKEEFYPSQNR